MPASILCLSASLREAFTEAGFHALVRRQRMPASILCLSASLREAFTEAGFHALVRRQRMPASMKPSISPSRTAAVFPVSKSVRRSFTIW